MDDFLVGVLVGVLFGILFRGSRRVSDEIWTAADEPAAAPKLEMVNAAEPDEEYEDPGKVERRLQLEQYRRLLREEFGVDHAGSLVDPMTGEEAATHG